MSEAWQWEDCSETVCHLKTLLKGNPMLNKTGLGLSFHVCFSMDFFSLSVTEGLSTCKASDERR